MNRKIKHPAQKLCFVAMAVCLNLVGGQIALMLRLPIYLDSIGTVLTGALLGPLCGLLPNLCSGILSGFTTDIYALYFAPVGMITGLMAGLLLKKRERISLPALFVLAAGVTVPGTLVSSLINALLFGGVTSSGSTILVQLLSKTPLGLTASIFVVQILTDYLDRLIAVFLADRIRRALPHALLEFLE